MKSMMLVASIAAVATCGAVDTWYYLGVTNVNNSGATIGYGTSVQNSLNWKNAATD